VTQAPRPPHPDAILAALADETRLKVYAAVVVGASDPDAIADSLGLSPLMVAKALARLSEAGLVLESNAGFAPVTRAFATALQVSADKQKDEFPGVDEETATELRRFFKGGRLTHIPNPPPKRMLILDYVARSFDPGVYYPERLVNAVLRRIYPDTASLRRFLVDEGFLDRKGGKYWRTGGTVPVD
jgi:hypothetical protein